MGHQEEDRTVVEYRLVLTGGNEPRMRDVGAGKCRKHPHLAPDRLIAVGAKVHRAAPEDVALSPCDERYEHVLRPTDERSHVVQRTRPDALLPQPLRDPSQVAVGAGIERGRGAWRVDHDQAGLQVSPPSIFRTAPEV